MLSVTGVFWNFDRVDKGVLERTPFCVNIVPLCLDVVGVCALSSLALVDEIFSCSRRSFRRAKALILMPMTCDLTMIVCGKPDRWAKSVLHKIKRYLRSAVAAVDHNDAFTMLAGCYKRCLQLPPYNLAKTCQKEIWKLLAQVAEQIRSSRFPSHGCLYPILTVFDRRSSFGLFCVSNNE